MSKTIALQRTSGHAAPGPVNLTNPSVWDVLEADPRPSLVRPEYIIAATTQADQIDASLGVVAPPVVTERRSIVTLVQTGTRTHQEQCVKPVEAFLKAIKERVEYVWKSRYPPQSAVLSSGTRVANVVELMQSMFMAAFLELRGQVSQKFHTKLEHLRDGIKAGELGKQMKYGQLDTTTWPYFQADSDRALGAYSIIRTWQETNFYPAQNTRLNLGLTRTIPPVMQAAFEASTYHWDPPHTLGRRQLPDNWQESVTAPTAIVYTAAHVDPTVTPPSVAFLFAVVPGYDPDTDRGLSMPHIPTEGPYQRMSEAAIRSFQSPIRLSFNLGASSTGIPPPSSSSPVLPAIVAPPIEVAAELPLTHLKRRMDEAPADEPPPKRIESDVHVLTEPPYVHGMHSLTPVRLGHKDEFVLVFTPMLSTIVRIGIHLASNGVADNLIELAAPGDAASCFQHPGTFATFVSKLVTASATNSAAWTRCLKDDWIKSPTARDRSEYAIALSVIALFILRLPDDGDLDSITDANQRAAIVATTQTAHEASELVAADDNMDFIFGESSAAAEGSDVGIEMPDLDDDLEAAVARINVAFSGVMQLNHTHVLAQFIASRRETFSNPLYSLGSAFNAETVLEFVNEGIVHVYSESVKPKEPPANPLNVWLYIAAFVIVCFDPARAYRVARLDPEVLHRFLIPH